jgi:hypothetical protein
VISTLQAPLAQPLGGEGWANLPTPTPIDTESKVCAIIDRNSFTLKFGPKPDLLQGNAASTYLICDKIAANSSTTESSTLNCTGCKVILPGGSNAVASEVTYCAKSDKLTLRGSKEQPVSLTIHAGGTSQTLTASELVVDIKPVQPPTISPGQATTMPANYTPPADPNWNREPNWNDAIGDPPGGPKEISR